MKIFHGALYFGILVMCAGLVTGQDRGSVQEAQLISVPKAVLPAEAKKVGLGGRMMVHVVIDRLGKVLSVEEINGPDQVCAGVIVPAVVALRTSAKQAVMKATFRPAVKNGEAVEASLWVEVQFPGKSSPGSSFSVRRESENPSGVRVVENGSKVQSSTDPPVSMKLGQPSPSIGGGLKSDGSPPKTVSGAVLNGKATFLARPTYPAAAKAVLASGTVVIQVLVDVDGTVYLAYPVSGHPLLRASARNAACSSTFMPTLLSGEPVRVSGIITYNFVP